MAANKKIRVVFDEETGTFSTDLTGFQGKGCGDVIKMFEQLGTVTKAKKKPEYHAQTLNQQSK